MRRLLAALIVVLVVGAGCQAPTAPTTTTNATTVDAATTTTASNGTPTETTVTVGTDVDASQADPNTSQQDRIGWEDGYAYNATLSINESDGLNETELDAVVARAMARVEHVRQLEFNRTVPVEVITRSELRNRSAFGGSPSQSTRAYQNTQWRALFLVGDETNSTSARRNTTQQSVLGYYSTTSKSIVIVSDSETPELQNERTLSHELVHALQDQHFDLRSNATTSDGSLAAQSVVEGDAMYVQYAYLDECGEDWECLGDGESAASSSDSNASSEPGNWGIYLATIFPYYDGAKFVRETKQDGGWGAVNDLYDDRPTSTEQVISPSKYDRDEPERVSLSDTSSQEWSITGPRGRHTSDTMGQALVSTMFIHTLYDDYNRTSAVSAFDVLQYDGDGSINRTDPLNHDLEVTDGWAGDRMYVYTNGSETGYVWKLQWDSEEDAAEFADGYQDLLDHWDGEKVDSGTYVVPEESPYTGAYALVVEDDTVTIVGGPSESDLGEIRSDAG
jgi:hypothetical protein